MKPIVYTIAGSDSGGGAGIQADLLTFQDCGAQACTIITALTAQNSIAVNAIQFAAADIIAAQFNTLYSDLPAKALKLGMLGNTEIITAIAQCLEKFNGPVICDPVMISTSGAELLLPEAKEIFIDKIIPHTTLLTPNLAEAAALLNHRINDIPAAAQALLNLGCKSVLIKGGHASGALAQDYFSDGATAYWLKQIRQPDLRHGAGCTLSAAITAFIAQDYSLSDAIVLAKFYVSRGIRLATRIGQGPAPVAHAGPPDEQVDFPWLSATADNIAYDFPKINDIGRYPLIDDIKQIAILASQGIRHIQLRLKNLSLVAREKIIIDAIALAKIHHIHLWINDDWQLAIKYGAYGVHLGQTDLLTADIRAIERAQLKLGISTHSPAEIARAHAFNPSYISFGPIFATQSKQLPYAPQGLTRLQHWCKVLDYPIVAIGGINPENEMAVRAAGASGWAMLSAVAHLG